MTAFSKNAPVRLLPQQFLGTVLALRPSVAVFDCDGTLWKGDAGYGFMLWSVNEGLVSRNVSDWIDSRYRLYLAGEVSEVTMCGEMVQMYNGLREAEIRKAAVEFFRTHIEASIFPEMRELVAALQNSGTDIWAVSSTNNWVIEAALTSFNIPQNRILAARVEVVSDQITSQLLDVPTDEAKPAALAKVGIHNPDAVFGNSVHDAAMLQVAMHPFAVNPSVALLEIVAERRWPVFYPQAVAPESA